MELFTPEQSQKARDEAKELATRQVQGLLSTKGRLIKDISLLDVTYKQKTEELEKHYGKLEVELSQKSADLKSEVNRLEQNKRIALAPASIELARIQERETASEIQASKTSKLLEEAQNYEQGLYEQEKALRDREQKVTLRERSCKALEESNKESKASTASALEKARAYFQKEERLNLKAKADLEEKETKLTNKEKALDIEKENLAIKMAGIDAKGKELDRQTNSLRQIVERSK